MVTGTGLRSPASPHCPSVPAHRAEKRCENEHKLKRDRECTKKRGEIENGKGTWIRMMVKLLGEHYASLNLSDFDDTASFRLEPALNAMLIAVPDLTDTARIDGNARIKNISGDDMVAVNRKNQKQLSARLPGRIWMAGPKMPKASDNS